jgi:hypothetical protein
LRDHIYSSKSDVWAFGILIAEIYLRVDPFPSLSEQQIAVKIATGELSPQIPTTAPQNVLQLFPFMWNFNPRVRIEMDYVCKALSPSHNSNSKSNSRFSAKQF